MIIIGVDDYYINYIVTIYKNRNFDGKFLISREGKVVHVTSTDHLESEIQRLLEISRTDL